MNVIKVWDDSEIHTYHTYFCFFLRVNSHAYFICSDPKAFVNDDSGLNTIWIACQPEGEDVQDFPTDYEWPLCIRETECTDLPLPSEASRLQKSTKIGDSVKIGEYVKYTCIDKASFHETPEVSFTYHNF